MKKTKINRLYDLYVDNPAIKDQEAAELLDTDYRAIGTMKRRLRDHGYIQIEDNSEVSILMPYKDQAEKGIGGLRLRSCSGNAGVLPGRFPRARNFC